MTRARVMRTLGSFVVLSVCVHLWLLYGMHFELPRFAPPPPTLQVRLQPAPPLLPAVLPLPRAHPAPASRRHAVEPVIASTSSTPPPVFVPAPASAPAPAAASAPAPAAIASPPAPPAPIAVAPNPPPLAAPTPLARRLPQKGEISYVLYLGNERFSVGQTTQTWEISGDNYKLASRSETTGVAALFTRQRIVYESRGKLTARGLRPERFTTERVRSGKSEKAAAELDWATATAAIGNPSSSVALPAGTQDLVSFMYQMGLGELTPGRIEMPVTNGWKLERYDLEIGNEQALDTPMGPLRAVPIKQVQRGAQETIELWLAPAYRWLPVRIRFFNREGEPSGEQLVSEIRVSED
ncbi:MAG: DUF3108 domain-containing protein [Burkholderiales bacterium]